MCQRCDAINSNLRDAWKQIRAVSQQTEPPQLSTRERAPGNEGEAKHKARGRLEGSSRCAAGLKAKGQTLRPRHFTDIR